MDGTDEPDGTANDGAASSAAAPDGAAGDPPVSDEAAGDGAATDAAAGSGQPGAVVFYWRPGCPFCMVLRWSLRRRGIPFEPHNIWQEPAAAATVRSLAGGNETVPTITVGGQYMVNPSGRAVQRLVAEVAPELLG